MPAAAIDNIQLTERVCERPTNLSSMVTSTNDIILTWDGPADGSYEVMYRNIYNGNLGYWNVLQNQSSPCTIPSVAKGRYQIWVRHHCGKMPNGEWSECDKSHWIRLSNVVVIKGEGCIDFADITNTAMVSGTYGTYANPILNAGIYDMGEYSAESRHTVNYEHRLDPKTGNALDVIPFNELVSVRLGNWKVGREAETITYTYTVDSVHTILLLKYAVVLHKPSLHPNVQPFFSL